MDITVTIDDHEVRAALEAVAARVNNLAPLFHEIGQYYEGRVLENFAKESDPAGNKWALLSAVTLMNRLGLQKGFKKSGALSRRNGGRIPAGILAGLGRNTHEVDDLLYLVRKLDGIWLAESSKKAAT